MSGKALVQSKSFWGWAVTAIPAAAEAVNYALGTGVVPPPILPWLVLGGGLLGLLGRLTASEPIVSVLPAKKPY